METRFTKKTQGEGMKAEEFLMQVVEEANEDQTQDVREDPIPPKKKKPVKNPPEKISKSFFFTTFASRAWH